MRRIELPTTNGQTTTIVVDDDGAVTVRIAKAGHNRAIAKHTAADGATIAAFLSDETTATAVA